MITPNYYLAWLDMKDAFYPVLIYEQHKKYLRFLNTSIAYQFKVMQNGYLDAMRVFTKILKPPFSCLREQNHSSVIYVDDSLLAGNTCKDCLDNIHDTKLLLEGLGFYIHQEKSVFSPTQLIIFLAFTFYDKISDQSKKKKKQFHTDYTASSSYFRKYCCIIWCCFIWLPSLPVSWTKQNYGIEKGQREFWKPLYNNTWSVKWHHMVER